MPRKIAVIDGNSLMHRAFHAVTTPMTAPDGTPTNAVFGFFSMLLKFIDMEHPDALVCAFDAGKPEFRMKAIEQYKANRPPMDPLLKAQFPVIEDMLRALNIPVVKLPGWEGDDILGSVSALCEEQGDEALLVSGDKDVCQLVSDKTRVVTTKKGMSDVVVYGPAEVEERYGVTPAQFIDYLGLKGDTSDNIPGVPGIGEVTAKRLLQKYGSMEGIYENLADFKGKQLENLSQNKDLAFASREVATIVRDLDVDLNLDEAAFPAFTADEARQSFLKYRMTVHLDHLLKFIGEVPKAFSPAETFKLPEVLDSEAGIKTLEAALKNGAAIGLAVFEDEQGSLFGNTTSWAFALEEGCFFLEGDEGAQLAAKVMLSGSAVCMAAKPVLKHLVPSNTCDPRFLTPQELLSVKAFDCCLAAYVADSSYGEYDPDKVIARYATFGVPAVEEGEAAACLEAALALALAPTMKDLLQERQATKVHEEIDAPLQAVLVEMERTGTAIDTAILGAMSKKAHEELDALRQEMIELAGEEFNPDSPLQLSHILFEVLELTPPKKKTQRGYSTDASVLKELTVEHPMPGKVLKYREQAKLASTYLDALPRLVEEDGRVHGSFNQLVTTTGRLSSSDPNLQNIPVRTDFGRMVREAFVPLREGHIFLSADYSQIELRLLAHLSEDEALIGAFCTGADLHASTAARIFGVDISEVTPQMRSRAKAVNFGIIYGQQAYGLSQSLGIPFAEAKEIIERYFYTFPGVRAYLDGVVKQAREKGYAETMFGRRRYIAELKSSNPQTRAFGERTAMNHPMQGSAADIIKLAMRVVAERMSTAGLDAHLMIQVHDELDFSVRAEDSEALQSLVKQAMEEVVQLRVPLTAEVSVGSNWAQAH